ncbi:Fanconi anemia group M protein homolog [Tetranychus urticae]|uniref:DNA helicase n=1 Tax=Tetranychus urticae TaxID=32264 RepID=T1KZN3_TETUR|nr:Fanconi anemia group M protein homolog [Tetranychus urticae]
MTEIMAQSEEEVQDGLASGKIEKLEGFDYHAGRHWIYPINREIRDYQYCIVHQALFNNTLVVLPTGLGKTLIAAVVMYNFYLWYPQCKIVFMAPTRPLVKQQMEACFDIVGIPREDIVELTGHTTPFKRQDEWETKRLFFLTPQVMQNDLFLNDYCPAEKIKCIVVDEAHKATGGYAYTRVIEEVHRRNNQFRVLALSATPGKDLIHIKQVLKNLLISKIEFRSEESLDVQKYTHNRRVETIVVQLDEELSYYRDQLLKIIEENLKTLVKRRAINGYDLNRISSFYLLMQKKNYEAGQHNIPIGLLNSVRFTFAITTSLVYALDLLKNHGLRSFYNHVKGNRGEDGTPKKHFNLANILKKNTILQGIMDDLKTKFEPDGNVTFSGNLEGTIHSVPGHPKLVKLQEIVLNHFEKEGEDTRIMIFSQFRASVDEITCLLRQHEPKIRPVQFVGQSSVKRKGFSQKQQLEVINRFRDGDFNVLVATCVAEEGLDIGNVDLIICYDANKSPIRLVQRMGRTGRAREGRIIVLATAGKEEEAFNDSVYNRKRVATNLLSGIKQEDLFQGNIRLYPKGLKPNCRKLHLGIRKETEETGCNDEERENESNGARLEKEKSTKKRRSSTKEVKRKSTESTRSSVGSTAKKRKNRFIFQDDGDDELVAHVSDDETPKVKQKGKRSSKSPNAVSSSKRRKKEQKNDIDSTEGLEDLNMSEDKEDEPNSRIESASSSFNEIPAEKQPETIPSDDEIYRLSDSPCSPERQHKNPKRSSMDDNPDDFDNLDDFDDFDDYGDFDGLDENEMIREINASQGKPDNGINENSNTKTTDDLSPSYSTSPKESPQTNPTFFSSLSMTQIKQKPSSSQVEEKGSKSVPAKRSKWAEFESGDDSYDSLDYTPL